MGKDADGYEGVHGGFSIGRRNDEGRSLLEFCTEADLVVMNSWFKNEKKRQHLGPVEQKQRSILCW